ncbi:NmrA/HSCARG family protein [Aspergillus saccharolyticus JOP 1030-1]|uniref:NmrA-domain-containing protein n=1 Tax=Aspergillus saccharolyticus JOP 1030-1 TaxID=1450539 RepID=A0A319A4N8_9EURO|nr:NmrA-domain-containing protein [Aspergillus saccharolyticus JOP 1030-1]PYH47108.1 NmrA-domain-containing protein [Aspergillus saccharolyticus JOP 1030-1]
MSQIITVFGATGNQGGSVVKSILADPVLSKEWKIRGVTRDTSKPAAQALAAQGVELVTADMSSTEAALPAVTGAHTVFLVTDYWETMSRETEVSQGKAVADACKAANVKHLIFSSLRDVTEISNGRLPNVSHFDGKAEIEQYIRDSGIAATFVLAGLYMSNFFEMLNKQGDNYVLAWPVDMEKAQVPLFDPAEDTGKFVKAAIKHFPSSVNQRILAADDYYSPGRIVKEFEEVTGHKAQTATIPGDVFKSFLAAPMAQEILENVLLLEDPGYYAGESLAPSRALLDESDKPTSWKEFVARHKEKW